MGTILLIAGIFKLIDYIAYKLEIDEDEVCSYIFIALLGIGISILIIYVIHETIFVK